MEILSLVLKINCSYRDFYNFLIKLDLSTVMKIGSFMKSGHYLGITYSKYVSTVPKEC